MKSLLLLALTIVPLAYGAASQCSFADTKSGATYDLSYLTRMPGQSMFHGTDGSYNYTANVCGMVYGYGDCTTHQQSACQFTVNNLFVASLGQYQPPAQPVWSLLDQSNPFAGVQQTFTNGDLCYILGRQVQRTVNLQFDCRLAPFPDPLQFTVSEDTSTCTFNLVFPGQGCLAPPTCQYLDRATNASFDLSPLTLRSGRDYTGTDGSYTYSMNVCGTSVNGGNCTAGKSSVCQYYGGNYTASLGSWAQQSYGTWELIAAGDPSVGVKFTYSNGDGCWVGGKMNTRFAYIYFICDPNSTSNTLVVSESVPCYYSIKMYTKFACPR